MVHQGVRRSYLPLWENSWIGPFLTGGGREVSLEFFHRRGRAASLWCSRKMRRVWNELYVDNWGISWRTCSFPPTPEHTASGSINFSADIPLARETESGYMYGGNANFSPAGHWTMCKFPGLWRGRGIQDRGEGCQTGGLHSQLQRGRPHTKSPFSTWILVEWFSIPFHSLPPRKCS